ncbi:cysteine desulfurase family protein [Pueribacillus sp. YX66]|uniref:cysteine desulfurase family protein n=1 Tax=Pueribacillus sp. YX66 TaxID=3229242 RepID=UPI00358D2844
MIYLDNSATTEPYKEVIETFTTVSEKFYGNPSSLHEKGWETERLIERARQLIGKYLHVKPQEIVFTSGGTEGNNLAIKGVAFQFHQRGKHMITTEIEHPSSIEAFRFLETLGFDVTYLPVDENGLVSAEAVREAVRDDTILVSIIHVNNEIGSIQPIEEIGAFLKTERKIIFHVDHVQGLSKVPLSFYEANIDLCTVSGHKIHGLKGTGLLYVREGLKLTPLLHGGGQENGFRSGTENVAGIVSLAKAIRLSFEKANVDKLYELKQYVINELEQIEGLILNTPKQHSAPHIVNFSLPGYKPEVLIHALSKKGISLSTKSACSSKQSEASHVILAIGENKERAQSALRVSMSFHTEKADCEMFIHHLREQKQWIGGS